MSSSHKIAFVLSGSVDGVEITPGTIGLSQFNEFNKQVADFITGSDKWKLDGVTVDISKGSYKLTVVLTAALMSAIEPDLVRLQRQDSLGEIDPKRAEIVTKWQTRAKARPNLRYAIRPEQPGLPPIELSDRSDYRVGEVEPWVKVEKYLFGTLTDMGGAHKANVHLRLTDTGETLNIDANQTYLKEQTKNHLYHKVLVRVEAEQHTRTQQLRKLRLLSFEDYEPKYDEAALDRFAEAGRRAWADVPDASAWLRNLRGGA